MITFHSCFRGWERQHSERTEERQQSSHTQKHDSGKQHHPKEGWVERSTTQKEEWNGSSTRTTEVQTQHHPQVGDGESSTSAKKKKRRQPFLCLTLGATGNKGDVESCSLVEQHRLWMRKPEAFHKSLWTYDEDSLSVKHFCVEEPRVFSCDALRAAMCTSTTS